MGGAADEVRVSIAGAPQGRLIKVGGVISMLQAAARKCFGNLPEVYLVKLTRHIGLDVPDRCSLFKILDSLVRYILQDDDEVLAGILQMRLSKDSMLECVNDLLNLEEAGDLLEQADKTLLEYELENSHGMGKKGVGEHLVRTPCSGHGSTRRRQRRRRLRPRPRRRLRPRPVQTSAQGESHGTPTPSDSRSAALASRAIGSAAWASTSRMSLAKRNGRMRTQPQKNHKHREPLKYVSDLGGGLGPNGPGLGSCPGCKGRVPRPCLQPRAQGLVRGLALGSCALGLGAFGPPPRAWAHVNMLLPFLFVGVLCVYDLSFRRLLPIGARMWKDGFSKRYQVWAASRCKSKSWFLYGHSGAVEALTRWAWEQHCLFTGTRCPIRGMLPAAEA